MKILVISDVPWNQDNSVGNTYNNIFKNFKDAEFFNLYCKTGKPESVLVKKYFQITEKGLLLNLLSKKKNKVLKDKNIAFSKKEQKIYDIARILRFQSFFIIRELIWQVTKWKTPELNNFLEKTNPDIIFSFSLESIYYNNLLNYCSEYTKANQILFFADDTYSYINKNPMYLVYKFFAKKKMKKIIKKSKLLFGATPQICNEYTSIFQEYIRPLYKICENIEEVKSHVNNPITITYTGNLFYGRWKTIGLIAKAINEINKDEIKIKLSIYTTGLVTDKMEKALNINDSSQLLGSIPYSQVKKVLKDSDLVLHVESFEKKEIRKTRLSFSTKIVDCMQSGSCLLVVGPEKVASIGLLKDNNIAEVILINSKDEIKNVLKEMILNKNIIIDKAKKMSQYASDNHSLDILETNFYRLLKDL